MSVFKLLEYAMDLDRYADELKEVGMIGYAMSLKKIADGIREIVTGVSDADIKDIVEKYRKTLELLR